MPVNRARISILYVLATVVGLVGAWALTTTTRLLVVRYDLVQIELAAGTYSILLMEDPRRLEIRSDQLDANALVYYPHEVSYTSLARCTPERPMSIWFEQRQTWVGFGHFGTLHAVRYGDEYIFDLVNTYLIRRRFGARAGLVGTVLLLIAAPALLWLARRN